MPLLLLLLLCLGTKAEIRMMLIESSESIKDCYVDVGRWAITYYFVELKDHFCTGCRVFRESQLMHFCFNPKKKRLGEKIVDNNNKL